VSLNSLNSAIFKLHMKVRMYSSNVDRCIGSISDRRAYTARFDGDRRA